MKEQLDLSENKLLARVGKQLTSLKEQIGEHLLQTGQYVDQAVVEGEQRILQRAFAVIDNAQAELQTSMRTNAATTWTWACSGLLRSHPYLACGGHRNIPSGSNGTEAPWVMRQLSQRHTVMADYIMHSSYSA